MDTSENDFVWKLAGLEACAGYLSAILAQLQSKEKLTDGQTSDAIKRGFDLVKRLAEERGGR
jgi:hypothetical protein